MGWTTSSSWLTKNDVIEHVTSNFVWGDKFNILKTSNKGICFWLLVEYTQGERKGERFIALYLINKDSGEYGYKDMDESCGPCYYNCPINFINEAAKANIPTNKMAVEWRQKVLAFHEQAKINKAAKEKVVAGAKVKVYGVEYELLEKLGPRKGWSVRSLIDGIVYRMSAKQFKGAEVIS